MSRGQAGGRRRPPAVNRPEKPPPPHLSMSVEQRSYSEQHVAINTSGLPDFKQLAGYESVVPGSGDRILVLVEDQASHRRDMERAVIGGDNVRAYVGMAVGAVLQLCVIGGAVYLGNGGHDAPAIALATGGSVTGLSTIWSNWSRSKERAGRMQ